MTPISRPATSAPGTLPKPPSDTTTKATSASVSPTLGAMYAGLIIGLIQALSAYWFGPIYKDIVVYALFVSFLWFRPQGLMGKS